MLEDIKGDIGIIMDITEKIKDIVSIPRTFLLGVLYDKRLCILSDLGGVESLWALNQYSGELTRLTNGPVSWVALPPYFTDKLVFTRDVSRGKELQLIYSVEVDRPGKERIITNMEPMRIFGIAFDGRRVVFTATTRDELLLYLTEDNSVNKICSLPGFGRVKAVEDRYAVGEGNLLGDPRSSELFIVDLDNSDMKIFTPRRGSINRKPLLFNGKILFESNFEGRAKLYELDPETLRYHPIVIGGDYRKYNVLEHIFYTYTPSKELIVVAYKDDGRSRAFLDGKELKTPVGTIGATYKIDDKLYMTYTSLREPFSILEYDLKTESYSFVYKPKTPKWLEDSLGNVSFHRITSYDGLQIPVYILECRNTKKPGPTVVLAHGGPFEGFTDIWDPEAALLASMGFHVVMPNYRGSTGYGDKLMMKIIGDPGGGDVRDIIQAALWAKNIGLADKLCIMGVSYGGYLVLASLAHKDSPFMYGVAVSAITDWIWLYENTDEIFCKFLDMLFAGNKDLMKTRSPINMVDKIKAPIELIHPQNDVRTPVKLILVFIDRLTENGINVETHIIPGIGHITSPKEQARIWLLALRFLYREMFQKNQS